MPQNFIDPHAPIQIGPTRFRTPEGFLVCEKVPIARTGLMLYHTSDGLGIDGNPDGSIYITRGPEDLFHPHTMASFVGKPLVDDHPEEDVTPANWRTLAGGHILNVYRGEGNEDDELQADLMFTDAALISAVEADKREVSCGYDAAYKQTMPGMGTQTDIIGNHLAIVERGRCGPRCSIGDSVSTPKDRKMPTPIVKPRVPFKDRVRAAFKDAEEKLIAEGDPGELDDASTGGAPESHVHVHLHNSGGVVTEDDAGANNNGESEAAAATPADPMGERCAVIEKSILDLSATVSALVDTVSKMVPAEPVATGDADEPVDPDEEDKEKKAKTKDSAAMETVFKSVVAAAEILAPGIAFPAFDPTAKRKATVDSMCGLRRKALDLAAGTRDGIDAIQIANGGTMPDFKTLDCVATAALFKSAANARGVMNNRASTQDAGSRPVNTAKPTGGALSTPAELNAFAAKHYAKA